LLHEREAHIHHAKRSHHKPNKSLLHTDAGNGGTPQESYKENGGRRDGVSHRSRPETPRRASSADEGGRGVEHDCSDVEGAQGSATSSHTCIGSFTRLLQLLGNDSLLETLRPATLGAALKSMAVAAFSSLTGAGDSSDTGDAPETARYP
jgi:hypothetical protein